MRCSLIMAMILFVFATPLAAAAQQAGAPSAAAAASAAPADMAPASDAGTAAPASGYILGAADVVDVSVQGRTDYNSRQRIAEDGTIQLQFLGVVQAANKTTRQLGDEISAALDKGGYFTHPVVTVDVASYASRYVVVLGSFGTPGLVPVDRPYHLSEIVARVGGIREGGADYVVLRKHNGEARRLSLAALATGDASEDPLVAPGDKIFNPPAEVFYISGQVKSPGAYAVLPNMTVRMAISRGGGLTDSGSSSRLTLTRGAKNQPKVELDSKIQAGDVIIVGERLF